MVSRFNGLIKMEKVYLATELNIDLREQGFNKLSEVIDFLYGGCFDEIIKENSK